jgi:hypothetical protein
MPTVQEVYSPDNLMKAVIRKRDDGLYQVGTYQRKREDSPDFGPNDFRAKLPGAPLTDTLESAIQLASRQVGAGTDEFID